MCTGSIGAELCSPVAVAAVVAVVVSGGCPVGVAASSGLGVGEGRRGNKFAWGDGFFPFRRDRPPAYSSG